MTRPCVHQVGRDIHSLRLVFVGKVHVRRVAQFKNAGQMCFFYGNKRGRRIRGRKVRLSGFILLKAEHVATLIGTMRYCYFKRPIQKPLFYVTSDFFLTIFHFSRLKSAISPLEGGSVAADMMPEKKKRRRGRPRKKKIVSAVQSRDVGEVNDGSGALKKRGRPKKKNIHSPDKRKQKSIFGENFRRLSEDQFPLEEYAPPHYLMDYAQEATRVPDVETIYDFVDMYEDDSCSSSSSLVFSDDSDEYLPASCKKKKVAKDDANKRNYEWKFETVRQLKRKRGSKKPSTGKRSRKIPKRYHRRFSGTVVLSDEEEEEDSYLHDVENVCEYRGKITKRYHRGFSGTVVLSDDEDLPYFHDVGDVCEHAPAPSVSYRVHFVQLDAVSSLAAADFEEDPLAHIAEQIARLDLNNAEPQDGEQSKMVVEEKKEELELAKGYLLNFGSFIKVCDSLTQLWAHSADDIYLVDTKSVEEESFDEIECYSD